MGSTRVLLWDPCRHVVWLTEAHVFHPRLLVAFRRAGWETSGVAPFLLVVATSCLPPGPPKGHTITDPVLPILSVLGYWAMYHNIVFYSMVTFTYIYIYT